MNFKVYNVNTEQPREFLNRLVKTDKRGIVWGSLNSLKFKRM